MITPEELRDWNLEAWSPEGRDSRIYRLIQYVEELQAENTLLKTAGIIEVAIRNPSVSDYMDHLEKRTLSAERRENELETTYNLNLRTLEHNHKVSINEMTEELRQYAHRDKVALRALELLAQDIAGKGYVDLVDMWIRQSREALEQAEKEME